MADKAKKKRSDWTRIAVEGATTDGREIERIWIEEMAAQYSPNTYGARLNCEHLRSMWPDGSLGAYGDVVALKAEEVEIDGKQKLALFAQIEPTESLIALNSKGQKIYTSIEVDPKFADTGKAYLVGLAITDSPASLGTEALQFSAKNGMYANRKQREGNLFTAADEVRFEFKDVDDKSGTGLFARVKELLKGKQRSDDEQFADVGKAIEEVAEHVKDLPDKFSRTDRRVTELTAEVKSLQTELTALKTKLGETEDHNQQQRPPATGGNGQQLAEC